MARLPIAAKHSATGMMASAPATSASGAAMPTCPDRAAGMRKMPPPTITFITAAASANEPTARINAASPSSGFLELASSLMRYLEQVARSVAWRRRDCESRRAYGYALASCRGCASCDRRPRGRLSRRAPRSQLAQLLQRGRATIGAFQQGTCMLLTPRSLISVLVVLPYCLRATRTAGIGRGAGPASLHRRSSSGAAICTSTPTGHA